MSGIGLRVSTAITKFFKLNFAFSEYNELGDLLDSLPMKRSW
jgi:hypothetical protein